MLAVETQNSTAAAAPAAVRSSRIAAIDWMRGLVMVLMIIDHSGTLPGRRRR